MAFLLGCGVVFAADDEMPDPEFLEYLGSDDEIVLDDSRLPFVFDMAPNSVHVVRFTAVP